jgi:methylthioribose-1-phosphate isomerase
MKTIWWEDNKVILINQQKLPNSLEYIECTTYQRVASAIKTLEIRGAPAIGVAAAMGIAIAAYQSPAKSTNQLRKDIDIAAQAIRETRPTARNLFWAIERMLQRAQSIQGTPATIRQEMIREANAMAEEDIAINKTMGNYGAALLEDGDVIGTICNAGWLATAGEYGTALGVIKVAHQQGKNLSVIALETRPVLQGARLTAFELTQDKIPVQVICDGALGYCLSQGLIDKFICGADRIVAKDGCHVINKVGTHTASLVAQYYGIPFYVAAPISTFDFNQSLQQITIEEREADEVTHIMGHSIVPNNVPVLNPAFDITPPELVTALITEKGVIYPPYEKNIHQVR